MPAAPFRRPQTRLTLPGAPLPRRPGNRNSTRVSRPPPVRDLVGIYEEKVASGEWSEGEGLVTMLRLFAGEIDPAAAAVDSANLLENEGTGIFSLASEYLETGTDENSKAEITRLLEMLVPSQEALLRYSQASGAQSTGGGRVAAPQVLQAADCATLWRSGFPDDRTPSFPCFLANSQVINGNTYQVFFPAAWQGDASKIIYYELTRQAIADSVSVMQAYGAMRPIYFVFSILADPDTPLSTLAAAEIARFHPGSEACPVLIYPLSLSMSESNYKQTIAHEIWHCFTAFNLSSQLGAGYASSKWWEESSAEYFSNLVYPNADYEYRWLDDFNSLSLRRPLTEMSYENFIFMQYLGNRLGPAGVVDFLRSMPTEPGLDKQLAALAAYPDIANLFEEFTRQFMDVRIADTSGRIHAYTPQFVDAGRQGVAGTVEVGYKSFVPRRYKVVFENGKLYNLSLPTPPADARMSFRHAMAPGLWNPVPLEIDAGCNDLELVFYMIGVGSQQGLQTTNANITAESSVCTAGCLVGTWEMDNDIYMQYMRTFFPDPVNDPLVQWVGGTALMIFDDRGHATVEYQNLTVSLLLPEMENLLDQIVSPEMRVVMNGNINATYLATETTITSTRTSTNLVFTTRLFLDGNQVDVPVTSPISDGDFAGVATASPAQYLCEGDVLLIETPAPGNPVLVWRRLSP